MHPAEAISVIASFGPPYKVRPMRFRWAGRLHDVKEVTYAWITREGRSTIRHFSVSDGNTVYQLSFNTASLIWRLNGFTEGS